MKRKLVIVLLSIAVVTTGSTSCSNKGTGSERGGDADNSVTQETLKTTPVDEGGTEEVKRLLTPDDLPTEEARDEFNQLYGDITDKETVSKLVERTLDDLRIDEELEAEEEKYGCSYELDPAYFVRDAEGRPYPGNIVILHCNTDYAEDLASMLNSKIVGFKAECTGYVLELSEPFKTYDELYKFTQQEFDMGKWEFSDIRETSAYLYDLEFLEKEVTPEQYE